MHVVSKQASYGGTHTRFRVIPSYILLKRRDARLHILFLCVECVEVQGGEDP